MPFMIFPLSLAGRRTIPSFVWGFRNCSAFSFLVIPSLKLSFLSSIYKSVFSQGPEETPRQILSSFSTFSPFCLQIWLTLASLNSVLYLLNPVRLLDSVDFHSPLPVAWYQFGELCNSPPLFPFFHVPPIAQCLRTNGLIRTTMEIPQLFTPLENSSTSLGPTKKGEKIFF